MTTAVVTDSTTSLPDEVRESPNIRVVPLTLSFGPEETYTDKVDLPNAEFYEKLRNSPTFPTTHNRRSERSSRPTSLCTCTMTSWC